MGELCPCSSDATGVLTGKKLGVARTGTGTPQASGDEPKTNAEFPYFPAFRQRHQADGWSSTRVPGGMSYVELGSLHNRLPMRFEESISGQRHATEFSGK